MLPACSKRKNRRKASRKIGELFECPLMERKRQGFPVERSDSPKEPSHVFAHPRSEREGGLPGIKTVYGRYRNFANLQTHRLDFDRELKGYRPAPPRLYGEFFEYFGAEHLRAECRVGKARGSKNAEEAVRRSRKDLLHRRTAEYFPAERVSCASHKFASLIHQVRHRVQSKYGADIVCHERDGIRAPRFLDAFLDCVDCSSAFVVMDEPDLLGVLFLHLLRHG